MERIVKTDRVAIDGVIVDITVTREEDGSTKVDTFATETKQGLEVNFAAGSMQLHNARSLA